MANPAKSRFKADFMAHTRQARDAKGLTQEQMATMLGLGSQAHYNKYETRSMLPHHLVMPFCLACDISVEFLYTGKAQHREKAVPAGKRRAA